MEEKSKVSVIVPIYGVEKFIERCALSLFNQTLDQVQFIFVNDATKDKSISILKSVINDFPQIKDKILLISHDENKGLPAARNTGLSFASGEYIFHCDSDDYLEPDALEQMYAKAKEEDADIVWCDWFLTYETKERYMKQPAYEAPMEALKAMLSGAMKYNVWNKLVRRSLYTENKIEFPSGYGMGEDMTMILLMAYAKKVAYLPKAFYHYVKFNTEAFSQTYSDKHMVELRHNVDRVIEFIQGKYTNTLDKELNFFKLDVKFPFLITDDRKKFEIWCRWYPEANAYIGQNNNISWRSKMLQILADKGAFLLIKCYYILVYKILYKSIYQ